MVIHDAPQGSVEWLKARLGVVTASEMDQLLTPAFEARKGEMPKSYVAKKCAEKITGDYMDGLSTFDMEQGQILECEALPWLAIELDCDIDKVGLCLTDDGRAGASPDGLIFELPDKQGETRPAISESPSQSAQAASSTPICGVEIKAPHAKTHAKYLLAGVLPPDYAVQVHASMFVTGLTKWYFVSYHRKLPKLVIVVERDETIIARIGQAVSNFVADMDAALTKIGGMK